MKMVPQMAGRRCTIEEMTNLLNTALEGKKYLIDFNAVCVSEIKIRMKNNRVLEISAIYDKLAVFLDDSKDAIYWPISDYEKKVDIKFLQTYKHLFEKEIGATDL